MFAAVWPATAIAVCGAAIVVGRATGLSVTGILLDRRDRYSLTRLQLVSWSVVVISLVATVALLRLLAVDKDPLGFVIADELLIVMGVSLGSAALATAAKANHDAQYPEQVAASSVDGGGDPPRWTQLFLYDEGEGADRLVDLTKFQNLLLTIVVVVAYCASVLAEIGADATTAAAIPGFSQTLLVVVAVSHAGYVAGKLPPPTGIPRRGETLAVKELRLTEARTKALIEKAATSGTTTMTDTAETKA